MKHLFTYGTLMCADIMAEVAGCSPNHCGGVLDAFSRRRVRDAEYPGIVPQHGATVRGVVYFQVPEHAWQRLDRFEGRMYIRRRVVVRLESGRTKPAQTYVVRPEYIGELEDAAWDFQEFLHRGKARFQRSYRGYGDI